MLIGGLVFVGVELVVCAFKRRRPRARDLLIAFAAGALGGAVGRVAMVGLRAAGWLGTTGRVVASGAAEGATALSTLQAGHNVAEGKPVLEGTGKAAAFGAAGGAVVPAAVKVVGPVVRGAARKLGSLGRGAGKVGQAAGGAGDDLATATGDSTATRTLSKLDDAKATAPGEASGGASDSRGAVGVLKGEKAGKGRVRRPNTRAPPRLYRTIHAAPPAWLEGRFASTLAAVERNTAAKTGVAADREAVRGFLNETYEHINEVNALIKALGGKARPIPRDLPAGARLGGVHDFGERVSVRRLEAFVADLRRNPIRDSEGVPLEVPAWLARMPGEARAAGLTHVDVGKLAPNVAAGLGRRGPPDPFAIKLHNLSGHHTSRWPASTPSDSPALIEAVADRINAMRQPRVYRPEPLPFDKIRLFISQDIERGVLPESARPLLERALQAQARLEQTGAVNPYHLLETSPPVPVPTSAPRVPIDAPLGE